jgi:hypothetical protein
MVKQQGIHMMGHNQKKTQQQTELILFWRGIDVGEKGGTDYWTEC